MTPHPALRGITAGDVALLVYPLFASACTRRPGFALTAAWAWWSASMRRDGVSA